MAKVTGAELLRLLRAKADHLSGIADLLRKAVMTVTDPIVHVPRGHSRTAVDRLIREADFTKLRGSLSS